MATITRWCDWCGKESPIKAKCCGVYIESMCADCGSNAAPLWDYKAINKILDDNKQLQQRLATAESHYDELSRQNNALKNTVKLFYRKHCLNDDSIGWDELGDNLYNALAKTLGDKEFCKWLDTQSM